ncbi:MAG: iron-containing redox enzyme family protein [Chloroflexi bacterium]|nr:iron-containing redox enzyme family protein [Chloroflexota bacterium]
MTVLDELDELVDRYVCENRWLNEPITLGRARAFAIQHRLNTRQRNSVLKLRVATNVPDWDLRIRLIGSVTQEVVGDHEFAGGRPHWMVVEDLGMALGLTTEQMRSANPSGSTELAWAAWQGLMAESHWLEGIVANTCAERPNVPGYGRGQVRTLGWSGYDRRRWHETLSLADDQLTFWKVHSEADLDHSNTGWNAVAEHAARLHMEGAVVDACRRNLIVWKHYWEGIADWGDQHERDW